MRFQVTLTLAVMNFKFLTILILILSLGCKNSNDIKNQNTKINEASIISVLIDELTISFPPPPPPIENSNEPLKPLNLDSLNTVKVRVILDTVFENYSKITKIKSELKDFQYLVDEIPNLKREVMPYKNIKSKKGHTLIFGNSLDKSKTKTPQIIGTSPIAFNKEQTKAAVYAGRTTGKLSAIWDLYLLEKINGKWTIVFRKNIQKA